MTARQCLVSVLLCGCLSLAAPANADVVTDWNEIAVAAIVAAGPARPPGTAALDLAMVQTAVHDAVQAYQGRFEPYVQSISGASGSPVAAAAKAAHDVLVHQFPAQTASLDTTYDNYLTNHGLAQNDAGVLVGQQAAAGIINARTGDGSFPASFPPFTGGTDPGQWRPTLPLFAPMAAPWFGAVTPFALKDSTQLRPAPPPPALTSGEYTHAYNEIKALGAKFGSARTPEQTEFALFWGTNYLRTWWQVMRDIADAHLTDIGDSARLFALAAVAAADALIGAWDTKKYYNLWRPITAIQEGDNDGNPNTIGDPTWLPLLDTPPYQDYTSGATNFTSAVTRTLTLFFKTDAMTYSVTWVAPAPTSPPPAQLTRTYSSFSAAIDDVVLARILEGIHFRFADTVARRTGKRSADWAFSHVMRPIQH
jgi:hypothetical protein